MMSFAIDTLRYAKSLRAAGVSEQAAEAHAEALSEAIRDHLVTKADLNEAVEKLRDEMRDLGTNLRGEMGELAANLRVEIHGQQVSLLRWLVPLLIGQLAAFAALTKLL